MVQTVNIPIREEFKDPLGRFSNYDTYDQAQRLQLAQQAHVDIRSFVQDDTTLPISMLELDTLTMLDLDGETMGDLEATDIIVQGEHWSAGTVGVQTDRNNVLGLSLSCTTGANTTSSVSTACDISDLNTTDFITVALPVFPLANLTTASSYVDFTSNASGDFTAGPTDSIPFSSSTVSLIAGDSEFRFPISSLVTVNRSAITGVRFRIQATGSCTFRCLAVRAVSANWKVAPLDFDTRYNRARRPVGLNGSATPTVGFPTNSFTAVPSDWPILFRSDDPPGITDPRPIDASISMAFNPGSQAVASGANSSLWSSVSLYLRELALDENTGLDLDGDQMDTLDNLHHQPDFGTAKYLARTQADLEGQTQSQLEGQTQWSLERLPDNFSAAWIETRVRFSASGAELWFNDATGNTVSFTDFRLDENQDYILIVDLKDHAIRAAIYELDSLGNIQWDAVKVDTSTLNDWTYIRRRRGRVGWYAHLLDGDASVQSIRPRSLNFGEFRTNPAYSNTPVDGVRVTAEATPDLELYDGLNPGPWGGTITLGTDKSNSGKAFKVKTQNVLQGIATNYHYLEDFDNTEIRFDLFFPAAALVGGYGLDILLQSDNGRLVLLHSPTIQPERWQHIKIYPVQGQLIQTGLYRLIVVQSTPTPAEWYLDNISIKQRVIGWEARGRPLDAWGMNEAEWTPVWNTLNQANGGVMFDAPGDGVQIRALTLQQSAQIASITYQPRYSELGLFRWAQADTIRANVIGHTNAGPTGDPVASFTMTALTPNVRGHHHKVLFDATSSTSPPHLPLTYEWSFEDGGRDVGPVVVHHFKRPQTYSVTLVVRDTTGASDSITQAWAV